MPLGATGDTAMNNEKNRHLSMDQLLKAVVDEETLSHEMRHHMVACPRCKAEKEKIERHLDELSQMAKQMTPLPTRSIILPEKKIKPFHWWDLRFRPAFGIVTALCLVVTAVWWSGRFKSNPKVDQVVMNQELQEAEQFMIDVGMVVENALPQAYQDVLTVFEAESEEDFMQFIVPTVAPDDSASLLPKKEEERC